MKRSILLPSAMLAVAALALSACAHDAVAPEVRTVEVKVPVVAPCVSDQVPAPPAYADTDEALKAARTGAERLRLLAVGRVQRIQRLLVVEPVLEACRMPTRTHDGP